MADSAQIDSADPPVAPPSPPPSLPLQLNGDSELAIPASNSSYEGIGAVEKYPQSNGVAAEISANRSNSPNPPVAPPPPPPSSLPLHLNGDSELANEGIGAVEKYPQSNGVAAETSANRSNSADPPVSPPPPQLNGDSELATPVPNSIDEGVGAMENYPQSSGAAVQTPANRRVKTLRVSEDHLRRRSPRLSGPDEMSPPLKKHKGGIRRSPRLSGPDEMSPPLKKHKGGKKASFFVGEPVPDDEARRRWTWRYEEAEVCAAVMRFNLLAEVFLFEYISFL